MKVIEFHPDDLLDRELSGTLTSEEQARLAEHLAHCHACRLERQLRADFTEELAPPGTASDVQLFVSGAMQVAQQKPEEQSVVPSPAGKAPGRRRHFVIVLAATLTLGAGLALGQDGWGEEAWRALGDGIGSVFQSLAPASSASRMRTPAHPKPARGSAELRGAAASGPEGSSRSPQTSAEGPSAAPAPSPTATMEPLQPLPTEAPAPALGARGARRGEMERGHSAAAALFEQANGARRAGRTAEAGELYRALQARFSRSAEARLSLAVVARMQLDRGEYTAALAGFEDYLASSDRALREEAMAGRALALAQLGRTRASEQAFAELLRAYPESAYAALARRRLGSQVNP